QPVATAPLSEAVIGGAAGSFGNVGKRPSELERSASRSFESPFKKPRLVPPGILSHIPPPRILGDLLSGEPDLPTPLLFSKPSKPMTIRQSSFASETAATMMVDHDASGGITTLRLPKSQVSSPPRSSSTPGSWPSTEPPTTMRSPVGRPQLSPVQLLHGIGVVEFLEQDERPTFVIDLNDSSNFDTDSFLIVYANTSLRSTSDLFEQLQPDTADPESTPEFPRFKAWAVGLGTDKESRDPYAPSMSYGGIDWTCSTLRRRFRFVCGNASVGSITPTSPIILAQPHLAPSAREKGPMPNRDPYTPDEDYFGVVEDLSSSAAAEHSEPSSRSSGTAIDNYIPPIEDLSLTSTLSAQMQTTFDWTRIPLDDPNLGAHHRFARSVDWASTSLGPVEEWASDLRIMSNMIMGSPHPAAMYWGHDHVAIYNEAYVSVAGQKHPQLMGTKYSDAWAELWDEIGPVLDGAWDDGNATMKYDDLLFLTRNGFVEETYFNWGLIPLVGGDGSVVAIYNPAFENTRRKISERRMLTLRELGVKTSQARDIKEFWALVQEGLEYNEFDVPFALIYSVDESGDNDCASMTSGSLVNAPQIVLEGFLGVPKGHPSAVATMDLRSGVEGFAPYMRESMENADSPIVLTDDDGTLPSDLLHGLAWRGFGDPCRTIVVFPVHPTTTGDSVVGFIVLGVNPRRQYDDDYRLFVNLLSRQLATSMASVVLVEAEIKRGERAARLAALDRQQLSIQLHLRTQEAVESEYRFTRMAEFGPVGLFIADNSGHINYCNEMWWRISGHERGPSTLDVWMQSIRDEDRKSVESVWRRLVEEKEPVTHEFRFKGSRQVIHGHSVDTWALMSAFPEKDELGGLKSIFGCITDISQQKWAEDFQKQRRDEAVELKRQQENFIDITSHEMRNPLSAILQCADEISSCLNRYKTANISSYSPDALNILIDSCMEAANTISLCASHQKRIVDDILTLSKLDSNLLLVTPVDVQPIVVVQNVLKMFETELNSNDIKGSFRVEQSFRDMAINWVKLDPSRLRQVMINLMTNAIKFTQGRPTRTICISLGASKNPSTVDFPYIPPRVTDQDDITDEPDWGAGEKFNLHLTVADTGPGLADEQKKILFQRFSQASPRTHVQYGGSGLGLFICRILTEMQGGQIGVQAVQGEGSSFAFFIKSRKSEQPQTDFSASIPTPKPSPVKPSHDAVQAQPVRPKLSGPLHSGGAYNIPASPHRNGRCLDVLIVEDNLVNQKVLQRQLQLSGNSTQVANHGGEALEALRRSRFWSQEAAAQSKYPPALGPPSSDNKENKRNISVILMDLEMPVMDGMSCTREIRRLEHEGVITHHVPIIAVTAYARPEQIENAKAAGVDDVISKPFRIPELIPKIEELVSKYD
ncbi:hypothetical protein B0H67DRAFT_457746, partial [Lasiosphaeris hirsuta]